MIRVEIYMVPHGCETDKYLLGKAIIANIGGSDEKGNYSYRVEEFDMHGNSRYFRHGVAAGFNRHNGAWKLVQFILHKILRPIK